MIGQWLGSFSGSYTGEMTVNIEYLNGDICATFYIVIQNEHVPSYGGRVFFDGDKCVQQVTEILLPLDPTSYNATRDKNFISKYYDKEIDYPNNAVINIYIDGETLIFIAKTDNNYEVTAKLSFGHISDCDKLISDVMSWKEFKESINGSFYRKKIFRGQEDVWPLSTSFHRCGRYDLNRYYDFIAQTLWPHLSSVTKHVFNLDNTREVGAFLNLLQHHGYPTPLLDWSYSPYVAAFFAFRKIPSSCIEDGDKFARIFVFDADEWKKDYNQNFNYNDCRLNISVAEFPSINNVRSIPQQAITTVSNISNIESYIRYCENLMGKKYLTAIDIPISEKSCVDRDLSFMGVTAGSLFPGLDGACEHLKKIHFEI